MGDSRFLLPFLAFGALAASAQTHTPKVGRYLLLDSVVEKYSAYDGEMRPYNAHWPWMGGLFQVKSLEWRNGRAPMCVFAAYSLGDVGDVHFDECATADTTYGLRVSFRGDDTLNPQPYWTRDFTDFTRNLTLRLSSGDTVRFQYEMRWDTLRLSLWWLDIDSRTPIREQHFFPGGQSVSDMRKVTRFWYKLAKGTESANPSIRVGHYTWRFLPEGMVGLGTRARSPRPLCRQETFRPGALRDLIGRLRSYPTP